MAKSSSVIEAINTMDITEINMLLAAAQEQLKLRLIIERKALAAAWVKQAAALDATPEEILKYESSPLPASEAPLTTPTPSDWRPSTRPVPISRETVLQLLQKNLDTPLSVNEVCNKLNHTEEDRPTTAYYLKRLVEEKRAKRVGKFRQYRYHV